MTEAQQQLPWTEDYVQLLVPTIIKTFILDRTLLIQNYIPRPPVCGLLT